MDDFFGEIIGACVGAVLGEALTDRLKRRFRRSGRVTCRVRVIAGSQKGLNSKWKYDRAIVHPGMLEFGRWSKTSVKVLEVVTERQRRTRGRETFLIGPDFQIVELTTSSATLELAVHDDALNVAIAGVRDSEISAVAQGEPRVR